MSDEKSKGADETISSIYRAVGITFDHFETHSPIMKECLELARQSAKSDVGVLITGETGTGKNLLAQAIHNESRRKNGPFIDVNCSALTEALLESELFGHEKGAFTGAFKRHRGWFELADGGTIFLDEVGDFSSSSQSRLLRVLDYHQLQRIGGEKIIETDVRIVAATNLDIERLVRDRQFREDLYYRLHDIEIKLLPLRDRKEDVLPLVDRFIREFSRKYGKVLKGLEPVAETLLLEHDWPGNVRELKSLIRRGAALATKNIITMKDLDLKVKKIEKRGKDRIVGGDLSLSAIEKDHILRVVEMTKGNKSRAAVILGISRSTLDRKLKELREAE